MNTDGPSRKVSNDHRHRASAQPHLRSAVEAFLVRAVLALELLYDLHVVRHGANLVLCCGGVHGRAARKIVPSVSHCTAVETASMASSAAWLAAFHTPEDQRHSQLVHTHTSPRTRSRLRAP